MNQLKKNCVDGFLTYEDVNCMIITEETRVERTKLYHSITENIMKLILPF
jgi:hypothetical protein